MKAQLNLQNTLRVLPLAFLFSVNPSQAIETKPYSSNNQTNADEENLIRAAELLLRNGAIQIHPTTREMTIEKSLLNKLQDKGILESEMAGAGTDCVGGFGG